jgi:hypothetical protein
MLRSSVPASEADLDLRVRRWDYLGVVVSGICVVHCMAMPLLLGLLPALGLSFLARDGFHQVLAALVLFVAIAAFVPGYRVHRQKGILLLGAVGIALLGGAAYLPGFSLMAESAVTAFGGSLLVVAHVLNRRRLAAHGHSHDHPH